MQNENGGMIITYLDDRFYDLENLDGEVWKDIEGYEGHYQVSNMGRIMSLKKKWNRSRKILKPSDNTNGYLVISMCLNGSILTQCIHKYVAMNFVSGFKKGMHVNHINHNKLDNRLCNLEYVTPQQNIDAFWKSGIKRAQCNKKLNPIDVFKIKELKREGKSYRELATIYKVHIKTIQKICYGKIWKNLNNDNQIAPQDKPADSIEETAPAAREEQLEMF